MQVAIPMEVRPGERRVAATPETVAKLIKLGFEVTVESNAGERRFIAVGMTAAEVIQRIGKPDVNANNQRGKGQHWSYLPKDGDPATTTTLTLVGGKVTDVERKVVR